MYVVGALGSDNAGISTAIPINTGSSTLIAHPGVELAPTATPRERSVSAYKDDASYSRFCQPCCVQFPPVQSDQMVV